MGQGSGASTSAALVIDTTAGGSARSATASDGPNPSAAVQDTAVRSGRLRRTATTVPQGTLIPAVLETALDSTRAGNVRAIVSRDVRGFDGSRVLIPRGSRLFGEYQTDLAAGQNRALVEWTRLVRPDGVTIALASPAGDLQGRTGIRGRVDSHFIERFGAALLQTTLNIGAGAAARSLGGDGGLVVALPGSSPNAGGAATETNRFQPTLRTEAGARVTVLVSRDLEFASGGARR
ncbi:TrbI/VirB10 family protein [Brevundimonas sp.]|uniref:TrbI/VirB10 family protein n=1 Tax=Brevundimonas sp. TaxID=1871086 RepID=UPI003D0F7384